MNHWRPNEPPFICTPLFIGSKTPLYVCFLIASRSVKLQLIIKESIKRRFFTNQFHEQRNKLTLKLVPINIVKGSFTSDTHNNQH